jgi:ABC-type phosphate transport system substrate-binding protein
MRCRVASLLLLVIAWLAFCAWPASATGGTSMAAYKVIVHPTNPISSVERKFLEDAFLKKVVTWPGGASIRPADLAASSPVRRTFSEEVLMRSVNAVRAYWQQHIFSGRALPPPELDTNDDVVHYVLKHEGAVGYLSAGASQGDCKVVDVVR